MKLPAADAVGRMLTDLLGRSATVKPTVKLGFSETGYLGELVDPKGVLRALTFSDRPLASLTGAALALIPRSVAEEAIRKGLVPPNLLENHYEIINIATALFNAVNASDAHVKLMAIHGTGPTLAAPIKAMFSKPTVRLDLIVDIAGYGAGKLSLLG